MGVPYAIARHRNYGLAEILRTAGFTRATTAPEYSSATGFVPTGNGQSHGFYNAYTAYNPPPKQPVAVEIKWLKTTRIESPDSCRGVSFVNRLYCQVIRPWRIHQTGFSQLPRKQLPLRLGLQKIKLWEEIVREYAVTPPLSPMPKVGPLPQFKISCSTIDSDGKASPFRFSSEPAYHKPAKRTPRRVWTDRLQEIDAYSETGVASVHIVTVGFYGKDFNRERSYESWTDKDGDKVIWELTDRPSGASSSPGRLIVGTGKYTGWEGTMEFTLQFPKPSPEGTMRGICREVVKIEAPQ